MSHCTHHHHLQNLHKSLCIALCYHTEASSRLCHFQCTLQDCNRALQIDLMHHTYCTEEEAAVAGGGRKEEEEEEEEEEENDGVWVEVGEGQRENGLGLR
ncbi:hypothetical protein PIB30_094595, partial [Stylosanthes scabra]|nr:hypothetical protein [Stylosanthes scabra]